MHALARRNPKPRYVLRNPVPASAFFRRWFGQSAVVDAKGKPLVVYHGTTAGGFDAFRPNYRKGEQLGFGIHFAADREFAAKYADDPNVRRKGGTSPKVYEVYLSIQRPLVADAIVREGSPEFALAKKLAGAKLMTQRGEDGVRMVYMQGAIDRTSAERAERLIREAGYDGIVYEAMLASAAWTGAGVGRRRDAVSRSYVVFEPTQVKSATANAGTFDPADPSILRNPAPRRRNPAPRYVLLGVDDEVQVCDDCGKADLKCTVVLGVLDADGNVEREVRFGRDCAAKALRKPSTVKAAKMESLAREAEYKRVWAMRVGAGSRVKVEGGRFPTYYFTYPLTDGRTLILQESDPSFRPPAGSWTRLREGAWVGHPAKGNPRRRNPEDGPARWYHASPAENRSSIQSAGLLTAFDQGMGWTPVGVYFTQRPPTDTAYDVWEADLSGFTLLPDPFCGEETSLGDCVYVEHDVVPSRLRLFHRGSQTMNNPRRRNPEDGPTRIRLSGFGKPRAIRPEVEAFLRDLFDASHPLPFERGERGERVLAASDVAVEVTPRYDGIHIDRLHALSARKGAGTEAMRFLTGLADKHGLSLTLYARPFGDEKMDLDALVRFYRRFGFREDEDADEDEEGTEMHRWPRQSLPRQTNPRRRNPVTLSPGPFGGSDLVTTREDGHAKVFVGTGKQAGQLMKAAYPKYPEAAKRIGKHKGKVAWLDYMEATQTGKGAGSRILTETLDALRAQGVEAVYLHAASGEEQEARVRFFGRHGFISLSDDEDRPRRLMVLVFPKGNPRRRNPSRKASSRHVYHLTYASDLPSLARTGLVPQRDTGDAWDNEPGVYFVNTFGYQAGAPESEEPAWLRFPAPEGLTPRFFDGNLHEAHANQTFPPSVIDVWVDRRGTPVRKSERGSWKPLLEVVRRRNPAPRKAKPPTLAEAGLPSTWFHGTQKTFGKLKVPADLSLVRPENMPKYENPSTRFRAAGRKVSR